MSEPIWTPEQAAIFDAIENTDSNIAVGAVAGSGKTTTTVEATRVAGRNVGFSAFGKEIAGELKSRLGEGSEAGTMHSFGYRVARARFHTQFDQYKIKRHLQEQRPGWFFRGKMGGMILDSKFESCRELVSAAKAACLFEADADTMETLALERGIELPEKRFDAVELCGGAAHILRTTLDDTRTCDYDDMIALPVAHTLIRNPIFDTLFIDECQDLNPCQQALSMAMGARKVIVGDARQAIMGFSGADIDSMPNMISSLQARELPLSFCWRCPANHLELARILVPHIQASPRAITGGLGELPLGALLKHAKPGDMVICRTNAPLVSLAYTLLAAGKPAIVKGRGIGEGLVAMLKRMKPKTLGALGVKLESWRKEQHDALAEKDRATPEALARVDDKADCLQALADTCDSVEDLRERIETMFADKGLDGKVVLSSIHRSKGLESDVVWFYEPGLCPITKDPQELNLLYVAITRSKRDLWFVDDKARRHTTGAAWLERIVDGATRNELGTVPKTGGKAQSKKARAR